MHKTRKALGLAAVFTIVASLLVLAAAPAQAAAGGNVKLLNPMCDGPAGVFGINPCPGGTAQFLSSKGGLTAELTAVADGGDDWHSATIACFYNRQPGGGINANWQLLNCDSTPTMPDAASPVAGFPLGTGSEVRPTIFPGPFSGFQNFKAFSIDVNTASMAGGWDFFVQVCGDGISSFDFGGAFDAPDRNLAFPLGVFPFANDCSGDGGTTLGWDFVEDVRIDNTRPVVRGPAFPTTGYHGDAMPASSGTLTWQTTADATGVTVSICAGVDPDAAPPLGLGRGTISTMFGGPGCAVDSFITTGGPTIWNATYGTAGVVDILLPLAVIGPAVRIEAVACRTLLCAGAPSGTDTVAAHYGVFLPVNTNFANGIRLVWDYAAGPGDRTCATGASAATSVTNPFVPTITLPPLPAGGVIDLYNTGAPLLKACVAGDSGLSIPLAGIQLSWEIVSGPGGLDSDSPSYREAGWVPGSAVAGCGPAGTVSPPCSGAWLKTGGGPVFNGYSRPGNAIEPPLISGVPFRDNSRVCGTGSCQRGDITNGLVTGDPLGNQGVDWGTPNSMQAGTSVYKVCVELTGNLKCDAGELSATASMVWTPAGRNHNHVWKAGTASANGHSGLATVAAPAGSTVDVDGWFHAEGHDGVPAAAAIWRIGVNAPGHFVTAGQTTDATGKASAKIGSSVLDAGRTTPVTFCGDGDFDGICDATPAVFEINWGGVVTATSISGFAVNPTIAVFGTTFTATGTLKDAANNAVSSATISIQRRIIGSSAWVEVGTAVTNGTGAFSLGDAPAFTSDYRAVFPGNVSYSGSTSGSDRAWVRVGVAMNVSDPTVFVGQTVRISGRVLPAHPGGVVTLQQLDNGRGWVNIASTRLSAASTYAFIVRHGAPKSLLFRVTFPTQGLLNAWNISRNVRVTWA